MGGSIMASTINSDTSNGLILTPDTTGEIQLQSAGVTKATINSSGFYGGTGSILQVVSNTQCLIVLHLSHMYLLSNL